MVKMLSLAAVGGLLLAIPTASVRGQELPLPGVGQATFSHDISVTLLDVRPLSLEDYRKASHTASPEWAGGGYRLVFFSENRPGAPLGPGLGEVKVFVDGTLYNPVTNPTSTRPLSPDVLIRNSDDFFSSAYGRSLINRRPEPRPNSIGHVLEVFVRGTPVRADAHVVVELEQGQTHVPGPNGRLRQLSAAEMGSMWVSFRFDVAGL